MAIPAIPSGVLPAAPVVPTPAAPATDTATPASGKGFGGLLTQELGKLADSQQQASTASEQVATGQSNDISTVAMQIEQASLSLQLAVQVRNKVVDAYNELFRMQI